MTTPIQTVYIKNQVTVWTIAGGVILGGLFLGVIYFILAVGLAATSL